MFSETASYIVREIADQSIIVLKNKTGKICSYYNVCQHRAHRLLEGEGSLDTLIRCPYHRWAYDHDGKLRAASGTEHIPDFDKSDICLRSVKLEQWCGFLFVNLDPKASPLSELCEDLEKELREFSPTPEKLFLSKRYSIPVKANWKNSMENFSECYHCPNQHPTLSENALDLETYKIECKENYHVHRSRDKGEDMGYDTRNNDAAKPNEFRSFYIWPNVVIEVYPGGNLTVFHHAPDDVEQTLQGIEWYFASPELSDDDKAVVDFIHTVRMEDVPICESVQKGLHSHGYDRGRLVIDPAKSYRSEHAVFDFQRKVLSALKEPVE